MALTLTGWRALKRLWWFSWDSSLLACSNSSANALSKAVVSPISAWNIPNIHTDKFPNLHPSSQNPRTPDVALHFHLSQKSSFPILHKKRKVHLNSAYRHLHWPSPSWKRKADLIGLERPLWGYPIWPIDISGILPVCLTLGLVKKHLYISKPDWEEVLLWWN